MMNDMLHDTDPNTRCQFPQQPKCWGEAHWECTLCKRKLCVNHMYPDKERPGRYKCSYCHSEVFAFRLMDRIIGVLTGRPLPDGSTLSEVKADGSEASDGNGFE